MAMTFQVAGEAKIQVKIGAGSFGDLGVSMDGVTIEIITKTEDINIDTFGQQVPFEVQLFLSEARIRAKLLFWDETIVETIRSLATIANGVMPQAGALLFAGGFSHQCKILAPGGGAGNGWTFPKSYLLDAQTLKVGTRRGELDLQWRAIPYTGTAGATTSAVLFTNP
jgi:hypothetical protein